MILKGAPVASKIFEELKSQSIPSEAMAVIQVGDDPISSLYVRKKEEVARGLGINFSLEKLSDNISESELVESIKSLNNKGSVGGYLIQIPLPSQISRRNVSQEISKDKDIDGFNYILEREYAAYPPTIIAIMDILDYYNIELEDKNILIVGMGFLVGKPLYRYLNDKSFDVGILEREDSNYYEKIYNADVVITATGQGKIFNHSSFKVGATVIDASTVSEANATVGDVDIMNWPEDKNLAPVPGGVGPVTVACLYRNFYKLTNKNG